MKIPKPKKTKMKKVNWCKILDPLCREIVFIRDGFKCVKCGATLSLKKNPAIPTGDWAHVLSKASHAIRWLLLNSMCMCRGCHVYWWHKSPAESGAWFSGKYPGRLDMIMVMRNSAGRLKPGFYAEKKIELDAMLARMKSETPLF